MHRSHSRTSDRPDRPAQPIDRAAQAATRTWLNLGIVAHVDAGKTSLTEALLYAGGALDRVGRVDDGTTQTDTLAQERRRGITIRTAVATFVAGSTTVNLIDTPGHPDFIAEVDRSLAVLDGAILVVSAVEGVQPQTVVLYRALRRMNVPAVFFVNKIDRRGADPDGVLATIRRRLVPALIPLGDAVGTGTPAATYRPWDWHDPAVAEAMVSGLAEHDEELLTEWVRLGSPPSTSRLHTALRRLTRQGVVHPVVMGAAIRGAGVPELITVVTELLPGPAADPKAPLSAQVFKIERAPTGERVCEIRVRAGTLRVRNQLRLDADRVGTVTAIGVHEPGGTVVRDQAVAGQIARVRGLAAARVGDQIGASAEGPRPARSFPPPALETSVTARDPSQQSRLHAVLTELADADPLIHVRPDDRPGVLRISVYGQVQQEVIAETLLAEHGIAADFEPVRVVCVERPAGPGQAVRRMGDPGHPYLVTIGLTIDPAAPGTGITLEITAGRQTLPLHVYSTVDGLHDALLTYLGPALRAGPHGWRVTDAVVTLVESGYIPPAPTPAVVRHTTAIVVAEALQHAGTLVCEPIDRFRLEVPTETLAATFGLLGRHRAVPEASQILAEVAVITGSVPTADVDAMRRGLRDAARGEGVLESELDHYAPIRE